MLQVPKFIWKVTLSKVGVTYTKRMHGILGVVSAWKPQHNRNQRWQTPPWFLKYFFCLLWKNFLLTHLLQTEWWCFVTTSGLSNKCIWLWDQKKKITKFEKAWGNHRQAESPFTLLFEGTWISQCIHILTTTLQFFVCTYPSRYVYYES